MKQHNTILIANTHAGGRAARAKRARAIKRFCARMMEHGINVDVRATTSPGDATRLAAEAVQEAAGETQTTVIASGGDGTINETLQGLIGTRAHLGVWPAGTANVLAREIKMPFEAERAADVIARAAVRTIHLGCATEDATGTRRYFFLMAGIGLDASVVRGVRPQLKRQIGEAAFWYAGLEHLALWRPEAFDIEIAGETFAATFAAIGKSPRYGGGLAVTPRARLEAPEFEVCIVTSRSRLRYLRLLSDLIRAGADFSPPEDGDDIHFRRATLVRARGHANVQADGELIGQLPMTFTIAPHTVALIAPVSSEQ